MPDTMYVREPGGPQVILMDRDKLTEPMLDRLRTGSLIEVDADGNTVEQPPAVRPPVNATKSEWVGFITRAYDVDRDKAEAMTKQDIIDMVNRLES